MTNSKGNARKPDDPRGYTDADMAEVADNPEWTDEELGSAKPLEAFAPELAAAIKRTRGKQKAPTKVQIALRLDPAVLEHYKRGGPGWQVRMGEVLKKGAGL